MNKIDLTGKTAVVTGGANGIGKCIVETLNEKGANVVIADLDEESGKNLAAELGDNVIFKKVNVTVKKEIKDLIDYTTDNFQQLDIMVNNAGISTMDYITDIKEDDWDKVMDINAKGIFLCLQQAANAMLEKNVKGKIINMASQAGKNGYRCMGNYCASKHAVLGITKVAAIELADDNINVNAVCPGIVETDMKHRERVWGGDLRDMSPEEIEKEDNSQVPLGRTAKPEDIAQVVLFLASEMSDYMTGQAVNVTGGMTMN